MKNIFAIVAAAGLAAPALAQGPPTPPASCLHVSTSFHITVNAPYAETAPLFGPLGERGWVGGFWDPAFLHPQPARDIEGAVFTIRREPYTEVWINTLFDQDQRHFQYVYFLPGLAVAVVDVRFTPLSAQATRVDVVFTRTATTPEGNEVVKAMSETDRQADRIWPQKIEAYLAANQLVNRR